MLLKKILRFILYYIPYPIFKIIEKLGLVTNLRICKLHSQRIGHYAADINGYLVNCETDKKLSNLNIIFFLERFVANKQILKILNKQINIYKYNFILEYILKFFIFWNKEKYIFEIGPYSLMNLKYENYLNSKNYFNFKEDEIVKVNSFFNKINLNYKNKWICFHNRDEEYLKSMIKFNSGWPKKHKDWSYHDHRNFKFQSMEKAALFFSEHNYNVFRMGSVSSEIYKGPSKKIYDYVNSEYQNDLNDVYLLLNCEFYFGSDSGLNVIPIISKKPSYIINLQPAQIYTRSYGIIKYPFIFKKIKSKSTGKLLTVTEMLNSNIAFSGDAYEFQKENFELVSNSHDEVLNFAMECLKEYRGEKLSKEDIELQDEFDNIYKAAFRKSSVVNLSGGNKNRYLGNLKIKVSPSFIKSNLNIMK